MSEKRWTGRVARAKEATASTAARAHDAAKRGAARTGAHARALAKATGEMAAAIPELIAGIDGPTVPLEQPWSIGFGQVIGLHPNLPEILRGQTHHLDRLGHLHISPEAISFDGEAVPWGEVDEIMFGPAVDLVTSHALQNEIGRLTARLPQFFGRDLIVRHTVEALVTVGFTAAGAARNQDAHGADAMPIDGVMPRGVPVMVVYGGPVRRRELTPGVFVALIAATIPSVPQAIASVARERGIKITEAPPSRSRQQAVAIRNVTDSLSARLQRGREARALARDRDPQMLEGALTGEASNMFDQEQPDSDGYQSTSSEWETGGFTFGPGVSPDVPADAPYAHHAAKAPAPLAAGPEFEVQLPSAMVGLNLHACVNQVGQRLQEDGPSSSGVLFGYLSPRALNEVVAELRRRRVITGEPAVLKRNGGMLHMRNALGQKVELWLYPVDHYPDAAVVVRHDDDDKIRPEDTGADDPWPAVSLAVVKTPAANIVAFDGTGKESRLAPSGALLEVLRDSYLLTGQATAPRDAQDFAPELSGRGVPVQAPGMPYTEQTWAQSDPSAPDYYLPGEEPGVYVPLADRHENRSTAGDDRAWFSDLLRGQDEVN